MVFVRLIFGVSTIPRLVKALSARALRRFAEIDPGLKAYKKVRYILLAFQEGCRWNNFTDDWNAQFVSEAATYTKVKNKMPQGTFLDNCIEDAMPSFRVQLACAGATVLRKLT